jgi:hypothetical protein
MTPPGALKRDAVYSALFNLVVADPVVAATFVTTGRLLPQISQVADDQCPALFMFTLPERRVNKGRGIPPIRTLFAAFVCYFATTDSTAVLPVTAVSAAADAIDNAIIYPGNPDNAQTLGGQVEHVYVEPDIKPYEGLLQEKSVLVAVVGILVP